MFSLSIAEAKNTLTRLIYKTEQGEAVRITRRGKPVPVLLSEDEYERLKSSEQGKDLTLVTRNISDFIDFAETVDSPFAQFDPWFMK